MATMLPVSLRATAATKTTLVIAWGAPESGTTPTTYEVRVDGGTPVDVGLTNTYRIFDLTPETSYVVEVRAVSADGPSGWVSRTMETVAFLREHFYRPVRNGAGTLMVGSTVAVYKTGTTEPLDVPIYAEPTGASQRGPAWLLDDGVVDFYLDIPQIVDIHIIASGLLQPVVFPHQWVGDTFDVDKVNDTVMASIDADEGTIFRQQQDARHEARVAAVATVRATAADLGSLTAAVNTTGKYGGQPGFDTTGSRPVWATGDTPASTWVYADGTTAFSPA